MLNMDKKAPIKIVKFFFDSVNIAAVAVMVTVLFEMSKVALADLRGIAIATISQVLTFGVKKANAMMIVIGGAIMGYLLNFI